MTDRTHFIAAAVAAGHPISVIRGETVEWAGAAPDAPTLAAIESDALKRRLKDRLGALRYARETGGITVGGVPVRTDERSIMLIDNALRRATFPITFKSADDAFISLDEATLQAVVDAATAHMQACFAAEGAVYAMIEAGTVADDAALDSAWAATLA